MPRTQQGLADAGRGGNEILLNLRGRNADECGQLHNAPSQTELIVSTVKLFGAGTRRPGVGVRALLLKAVFLFVCLSVSLPHPRELAPSK